MGYTANAPDRLAPLPIQFIKRGYIMCVVYLLFFCTSADFSVVWTTTTMCDVVRCSHDGEMTVVGGI